MIAQLSSKVKKQVNASFAATLLAICIVGTHWVGLNHGINHLGFTKQSICKASTLDCALSAAHSSDVCHLIDALTLAGCIPPSHKLISTVNHHFSNIVQGDAQQVNAPSLIAYQSQAPPPLHS